MHCAICDGTGWMQMQGDEGRAVAERHFMMSLPQDAVSKRYHVYAQMVNVDRIEQPLALRDEDGRLAAFLSPLVAWQTALRWQKQLEAAE